jgi:hypothetical protein
MAILIKATFTGEDGSLGYKKGEEHELYLIRNKIARPYGGGVCPYGSVEAFLKNWDNVKIVGFADVPR